MIKKRKNQKYIFFNFSFILLGCLISFLVAPVIIKKFQTRAGVTVDFGFISGAVGWFQTQDVDVYVDGNLTSKVPQSASPPYFSLNGNGGYPGVVVVKGNADFSPGKVSSKEWLVKGEYKGPKIDYKYLLNRLKIDTTKDNFPDSSPSSSGTYYSSQSKTITSKWEIPDGLKVLVFVDGDLTVEEDIEVENGGFLAVVVSGNIVFKEKVALAQGLFVSSKNIIVRSASPQNDIQFKGEGSFIGWEGIQLLRDLGETENKTKPAELFSPRLNYLLTAPQDFVYSLSYREELLP